MPNIISLNLIVSFLALIIETSIALDKDPYIDEGQKNLEKLFNVPQSTSPRHSPRPSPEEAVYSGHNTNPFVTPRSARTTTRTPRTPRTPTSTPGGSLRSSAFHGSLEAATISASPRLGNLRTSEGSKMPTNEGLTLKVSSTAESDSEELMEVEVSHEPMEVETPDIGVPKLSARRNSLGTPLAYKQAVEPKKGPNSLALSLNLSRLSTSTSAPLLKKNIGVKPGDGRLAKRQTTLNDQTSAQSMRLVNLESGFRRLKKNYDYRRGCYYDGENFPSKQPKKEALSNKLGYEHTLWWGRAKKMADDYNTKRMSKINLEDDYQRMCSRAQAELGVGQISFRALDELEKLHRPSNQEPNSQEYLTALQETLREKDISVSIQDIESILPRFTSNFRMKMTAIRMAKTQLEIATREFEVIQKRCQIQHVAKGKLTEIQNLADQLKLFHFKSEDEMMLRSFNLTEEDIKERKLFDSEDGQHVIFKLTNQELETYMYGLRRNYNVSSDPFVHPYQNNPKQLTGSNRVKCFGLTLQDVEIEIQMLQTWLNAHLVRESKIFDSIITLYGGDYCDKAQTSFQALQLQLKCEFNPSTVTVGKRQKTLTETEAIVRRFATPVFGSLLDSENGTEETDSSLETLVVLEQTLNKRYKALQKPENFLSFDKAYLGLDIRTRTSHPAPTETERRKDNKIVSRRSFFNSLPMSFDKINARNYNSCEDPTQEVFLVPFPVKNKLTMAADFPSIDNLKFHRNKFVVVLEELNRTDWAYKRQTSFNGPNVMECLQRVYLEQLRAWEDTVKERLQTRKGTKQDKMPNRPEQMKRPETTQEKLALHGELLAAYKRNIIIQSSQLDKLKGQPKGWIEAAYGYWCIKPFSFFFDQEGATLSDVFLEIGNGKIVLSSLGLTDAQLNRRRLVRDEADPTLYNTELALCEYSVIDLSFNQLANPLLFSALRWTLVCLDISNNSLEGFGWALELEKLVVLNVSNNPKIGTLDGLMRHQMSNLKELNIANIGLTRLAELNRLKSFMGLTTLDISFNSFEEDEMQYGEESGAHSKKPHLIALSTIPLEIFIAHECGFTGFWNKYFGCMFNLLTLSTLGNFLEWRGPSWDPNPNNTEFQGRFPRLQVFEPVEGVRIEGIDGAIVSLKQFDD